MTRTLRLAPVLASLVILCAAPRPAEAGARFFLQVGVPIPMPPVVVAPPVVVPPPAPYGFAWRAGYYNWTGYGYAWVPGAWMRPPFARAVWVGPRWVRRPYGAYWARGYWRR